MDMLRLLVVLVPSAVALSLAPTAAALRSPAVPRALSAVLCAADDDRAKLIANLRADVASLQEFDASAEARTTDGMAQRSLRVRAIAGNVEALKNAGIAKDELESLMSLPF